MKPDGQQQQNNNQTKENQPITCLRVFLSYKEEEEEDVFFVLLFSNRKKKRLDNIFYCAEFLHKNLWLVARDSCCPHDEPDRLR